MIPSSRGAPKLCTCGYNGARTGFLGNGVGGIINTKGICTVVLELEDDTGKPHIFYYLNVGIKATDIRQISV